MCFHFSRSERSGGYRSRDAPSSPPYTAYVGSLPTSVSELDVENIFKGLGVSKINIEI